MNSLTDRFRQQNPLSVETLTDEQIEEYATEHSGGLVVLLRYLDDDLYVKMHDSWGGDEEIVVHRYNPLDVNVPVTDVVWEFNDSTDAYNFFEEVTA